MRFVAVFFGFILFLSLPYSSRAQTVPQGINYQAVMRDNAGQPLVSQNVTIRFSLRSGSTTGTLQWQETHNITTNAYGLFTAVIGQGTNVTGNFSTINWSSSTYFLEVEGDDGSGYVSLGNTQLLTVPYAMHARTVEVDLVDDADNDPTNELQNLSFDSGTGDLTLSNGNTVNLPFSATGDNWGSQTVVSDGTLNGNGTAGNPLSVNGILTDNQTLSIIGNNVAITNGNTITLPAAPVYTGGTGINVTGTHPSFTITNTSPGNALNLTGTGGTSVSGTYPNLTINSPTLAAGVNLLPAGTTNQTLRHDGTNWVANGILLNDGNNVGIGQPVFGTPQLFAGARKTLTISAASAYSNGDPASIEIIGSTTSAAGIIGRVDFGNVTAGPVAQLNGRIAMDKASNMMFYTNGTDEQMRITSAGRLGIGTTTPATPLHVANSTIQNTAQFINSATLATNNIAVYGLADGSGTGTNIGGAFDASSGSGIKIGVTGLALGAGSENIGIQASATGGTTNWAAKFESGNVHVQNNLGINELNPTHRLHVTGNSLLDGVTQIGGTSGLASQLKVINSGHNLSMFVSGGSGMQLAIGNNGVITVGNSTTAVSKVLIQHSDANTAGAAGSFLNLQNTANANNTTAAMRFRVGGTTAINGDYHYKGAIYFSRTGANGEGDMIFALNNAANSNNVGLSDELMRLSNTANQNGLNIAKSTTSNVGYFQNTTTTGGVAVRAVTDQNNASATGSRYGVYATGWYGQSSNHGIYAYGYGGTIAYGVYGVALGATTNWAVYASGSAYSTGTWQTSDQKLKKNVSSYNNALNTINQLPIKTYYYDTQKYGYLNLPKTRQYGFMAQDLEELFPELVMDSKHDVLNENREPTGETVDLKVVNYDGLIPVLIRAMQEQQEQIEELKKEVEELKKK